MAGASFWVLPRSVGVPADELVSTVGCTQGVYGGVYRGVYGGMYTAPTPLLLLLPLFPVSLALPAVSERCRSGVGSGVGVGERCQCRCGVSVSVSVAVNVRTKFIIIYVLCYS